MTSRAFTLKNAWLERARMETEEARRRAQAGDPNATVSKFGAAYMLGIAPETLKDWRNRVPPWGPAPIPRPAIAGYDMTRVAHRYRWVDVEAFAEKRANGEAMAEAQERQIKAAVPQIAAGALYDRARAEARAAAARPAPSRNASAIERERARIFARAAARGLMGLMRNDALPGAAFDALNAPTDWVIDAAGRIHAHAWLGTAVLPPGDWEVLEATPIEALDYDWANPEERADVKRFIEDRVERFQFALQRQRDRLEAAELRRMARPHLAPAVPGSRGTRPV